MLFWRKILKFYHRYFVPYEDQNITKVERKC